MATGCDPSSAGPARQRVPFGLGSLLMRGSDSAPEVWLGCEGDDGTLSSPGTGHRLL